MSMMLPPMFSSRNFIVLGITFKSLIQLELTFYVCVRQLSSVILLHVTIQFSQHRLSKRLSFLHCMFFAPLSQINCPMCQLPQSLDTIAYSLKFGSVLPPALFFFLKIVVAIWGLLLFHTNFRIICLSSVKYAIGILLGIALSLQIALDSMKF